VLTAVPTQGFLNASVLTAQLVPSSEQAQRLLLPAQKEPC
jgi:hypothetical protein